VSVWPPAAEAIGLVEHNQETGKEEPWVGFHSFRHTCASMLIDDGKSIVQVAAWLGHENRKVTLDTYAHLMDCGLGDAAFLDAVVCAVVGNGRATQHPEPAANGSGVTRCDSTESQGNPKEPEKAGTAGPS
jgi:Phage integrase family